MEQNDLQLNLGTEERKVTSWKKWIFPTVCIILIFVGVIGIGKYNSCKVDQDVTATAEKVGTLAKEIWLLQYEKQKCKDSLTALQTIADYNGVDSTCSKNDGEIEKKKIELGAAYEFEYMRIDMIVGEMKEEKKFQEQVEYIENGTGSAVEKLATILNGDFDVPH